MGGNKCNNCDLAAEAQRLVPQLAASRERQCYSNLHQSDISFYSPSVSIRTPTKPFRRELRFEQIQFCNNGSSRSLVAGDRWQVFVAFFFLPHGTFLMAGRLFRVPKDHQPFLKVPSFNSRGFLDQHDHLYHLPIMGGP
jgi:hypothetical protein